MVANQDHFKFFIEDDKTFEDYIKEMQKDATWGGNLEIFAMSMKFNVNFYIYIYDHPMYIVKNFDLPMRNLHLTYHDGSHYNSVRLKDDLEEEIPQVIPLEMINCVEQTTNLQALDSVENGNESNDESEDEGENHKENHENHTEDNKEEPNSVKHEESTQSNLLDEINFNGVTIKDLKEKTNKYRKSIITQEGIVLEEIKDFAKCHCETNKKYKNCCIDFDLRGEYDKSSNIFYCDLTIFKSKFHYEIKDKQTKLGKQTSSDLNLNSVNTVTKQMEKIFI
jgi:hypothetical protein